MAFTSEHGALSPAHGLTRSVRSGGGPACPPEPKVSTPAHTKDLGWYLELECQGAFVCQLLRHRPATKEMTCR